MPTVYRYDISPNKRAGCQSAQCKADGIKIQKGELRFATLVTINDHDGWKYKHWGCVTPRQIANIIEQIGGLDGLDLEKDLDILDGYEELESWAQEKVKFALRNGHVEDEDWKGDLELNRPGQKGITKKRTPKKKKNEEGEEADGEDVLDVSPSKPREKKGGSKVKVNDEDDGSPAPPKKTASKKRKAAEIVEESESAEEKKPKKRGARKSKAQLKEEEENNEQAIQAPQKRGRKAKQPDDAEISDADDKARDGADVKSKARGPIAKKAGKPRKVKEEEDSVDEIAEEPSKPAKKKTARKTAEAGVKDEQSAEDAVIEPAEVKSKLAKRSRVRSRKSKEAAPEIDIVTNDGAADEANAKVEHNEEAVEPTKEKKRRTRSKKGKDSTKTEA